MPIVTLDYIKITGKAFCESVNRSAFDWYLNNIIGDLHLGLSYKVVAAQTFKWVSFKSYKKVF
jgi:hypothetical protein